MGGQGQAAACQLLPAQRSERSGGGPHQDLARKSDQRLMSREAGAQREQCVGKKRQARTIPGQRGVK